MTAADRKILREAGPFRVEHLMTPETDNEDIRGFGVYGQSGYIPVNLKSRLGHAIECVLNEAAKGGRRVKRKRS